VIANTPIRLASANHNRESDMRPLNAAMVTRWRTKDVMLTGVMIEIIGMIEAMKFAKQEADLVMVAR
jgi:hypothetical protein